MLPTLWRSLTEKGRRKELGWRGERVKAERNSQHI
jgi:hypothetical protein